MELKHQHQIKKTKMQTICPQAFFWDETDELLACEHLVAPPRTGRVLLALQDGDVLVYATTRGKSKARWMSIPECLQ